MSQETCWTLIAAVRNGDDDARKDFVDRYMAPVHAYLRARWKSGPLSSDCDDAAQVVFVRCFSDSSPLEAVNARNDGSFRAFLYGVCRNVAREMERDRSKRGGAEGLELDEQPGRERRLSTVFDRAFARQVMKEARERFRLMAEAGDEASRRRFELLGLRFEENRPIRDIAAAWQLDPAHVHKEYARARKEYREALLAVLADQEPGRTDAQIEEAARHLLEILKS